MNFLIKNDLRVLCQGFTGKSGTYHSKLSIDYGTNFVAGVTPGKGGTYHLNKPVFNSVRDAVCATGANASVIFVPAKFCKDSVLEAIDAGISLIVCITEGVPVLDMLYLKRVIRENKITFIGPNSPGFTIPGVCRMGIMPCDIHKSGVVGIISRSGTLTYEAIYQTTKCGLGQSVSIGIGGDPVVGSDFVDVLHFLENDKATEIILMIGEIGGCAEEKAANFIHKHVNKPVLSYIAGVNAPVGKRMGHAGAIISGGSGDASSKIRALEKSNVSIIKSLSSIGDDVLSLYNRLIRV